MVNSLVSSTSRWYPLSTIQSILLIVVCFLLSTPTSALLGLWSSSSAGFDSATAGLAATSKQSCLFESKQNDNYCDCPDGSDELSTSACSGVALGLGRTLTNNFNKRASFTCPNGVGDVRIPFSRVQDGVCDCCDGADEINSPFQEFIAPDGKKSGVSLAKCPDTCSDAVIDLQHEALIYYRKIQSGLRARTLFVDAYSRRKYQKAHTIESIREDRSLLVKLRVKLKYYIGREQSAETKQRFRLIRERQNRCAMGFDDACDYFREGWLDDDELIHDGYPIEFLNPKSRVKFDHSEAEIKYLQSLSGSERVHAELCTAKFVMPPEDAKIFAKVRDYLSFMESSGGMTQQQSRRRDINRRRRESTLFGQYLDNGEEGFLLGKIALVEFFAIVASPVVLALRAASQGLTLFGNYSVSRFKECADENLHGRNLCVIFSDSFSWYHDPTSWFNTIFLELIDLESYSGWQRLMDLFHPILSGPSWALNILWRAPSMYIDYYILEKSKLLPERRQNCLLRRGLKSAEAELAKIDSRLAEEEAMTRLLEEGNAKGGGVRADPKKMGASGRKVVPIDYGYNKEWESIRDVCVNKNVRGYIYEFCFFNSIKQNDVIIGKFYDWDTKASYYNSSSNVEEWALDENKKVQSKIKPYYKEGKHGHFNILFHHVFDLGDECPGKIDPQSKGLFKRISFVSLQCSDTNELLSVVEEETCVYAVTVGTPLACSDIEERLVLRRLEDLGVFGFSGSKKPREEIVIEASGN